MKRFKGIVIAYMMITIATINAQEKKVRINSITPNTIELTRGINGENKKSYLLEDSLVRTWSNYALVEEIGGLSALISNYASEIFILKDDSALQRGWPTPHYALQNSAYAIYDGKIYGYGGYGFWTSKNILRYWTDEKGWVPILTSDTSEALSPSHNSVLVIRDTTAYIFGGEATDSRNPFIRSANKLIQIVNLNTREVTKTDISYELNQANLVMENDTLVIFKGIGKLFAYNLVNKKITETTINEELDLALQIKIGTADFEKIIAEHVSQEKPISTWSRANTIRAGLAGLLILLILLFLRNSIILSQKSSAKIFLENDSIRYGNNKATFSSEQIKLIRTLMNVDFARAENLNALFSSELSASHLNKLRSQTIKSINDQIRILTNNNIDEFICTRKAKHDSRMVEYYMPDTYKLK